MSLAMIGANPYRSETFGPHVVSGSDERERERVTMTDAAKPPTEKPSQQLLHLVFGGELSSLDRVEFADVSKLDVVGIYPNYAEAYKAWRAAAQRSVDSAQMRYFIVHIHRLLDPSSGESKA
jgi:hypothetical protein